MEKSTNPLLQSYKLGNISLPNRLVMAPMTRNRAGEGNTATELMATYYRQRSSAGLIVSEGTQISEQGVGYPNTPGIHSEEQVESWKKVTNAVHEEGGKIFAQIWHVGRISHPIFHDGDLPVAPSAIKPEGQTFTPEGMKDFVTPRALETEEIPGVIDDYVKAAENVYKWKDLLGKSAPTPPQVELSFDDVAMVAKGLGLGPEQEAKASEILKKPEFTVTINLALGECRAYYYTSDLSYDYVKINADYRT